MSCVRLEGTDWFVSSDEGKVGYKVDYHDLFLAYNYWKLRRESCSMKILWVDSIFTFYGSRQRGTSHSTRPPSYGYCSSPTATVRWLFRPSVRP